MTASRPPLESAYVTTFSVALGYLLGAEASRLEAASSPPAPNLSDGNATQRAHARQLDIVRKARGVALVDGGVAATIGGRLDTLFRDAVAHVRDRAVLLEFKQRQGGAKKEQDDADKATVREAADRMRDISVRAHWYAYGSSVSKHSRLADLLFIPYLTPARSDPAWTERSLTQFLQSLIYDDTAAPIGISLEHMETYLKELEEVQPSGKGNGTGASGQASSVGQPRPSSAIRGLLLAFDEAGRVQLLEWRSLRELRRDLTEYPLTVPRTPQPDPKRRER